LERIYEKQKEMCEGKSIQGDHDIFRNNSGNNKGQSGHNKATIYFSILSSKVTLPYLTFRFLLVALDCPLIGFADFVDLLSWIVVFS
jgi:hypothetical protein